jgi:hypothetical protein
MAQRSEYWSCSKFADWLRGTPKGGAKTSDDWDNWHEEASKKYPVRYWIAEEGLDAVQNFIWWPVDKLYDAKYYINNRWISRTHSLTAHRRDIKPGSWCDVGNRFLPCLFNELVDFVEVELAWWHLAWSPEERPKYNMPWWAVGWWRIRTWRCPQAGLDNLKWQSELVWTENELGEGHKDIGKPTYQAVKAKEILELYHWWTEVYPNRPDVHDVSGWSAYCEKKRQSNPNGSLFSNKGETKELRKEADRALKLIQKIEKQYEDEDERMMIRLIKIRSSLWT